MYAHHQQRSDLLAQTSLGLAGARLRAWPSEAEAIAPGDQPVAADFTSPALSVTKQDEQAALRQYAATLLTEPTTEATVVATPVKKPESSDRLSPFSMAAMLLLAGCVFLVVIPPVGVTFLLCAVLPLIWGAGTTALGSS
jgi:hypothetical protein